MWATLLYFCNCFLWLQFWNQHVFNSYSEAHIKFLSPASQITSPNNIFTSKLRYSTKSILRLNTHCSYLSKKQQHFKGNHWTIKHLFCLLYVTFWLLLSLLWKKHPLLLLYLNSMSFQFIYIYIYLHYTLTSSSIAFKERCIHQPCKISLNDYKYPQEICHDSPFIKYELHFTAWRMVTSVTKHFVSHQT